MNDSDLYQEEDSRKSQNKGAILAQERCTVVLRRLFTFLLRAAQPAFCYCERSFVFTKHYSLMPFMLCTVLMPFAIVVGANPEVQVEEGPTCGG